MPECRSCRSQNPEEAAYCLRCGTKLETKRAHALAETLPCDMTSHKDRTIAATPSDRAMYAGAINAGAINSPAQVSPVPVIGHLSTGHMVDGKYAISSVLGGGAMGTVYLATDVNTNTRVVVKAIRPEYADRPDFRTRILAEGRALARIDHANVVRLNAVVVGPTDLYLVMQYVDGESLDRTIERYVQRMEYMPVDVALGFFEQVLEGVGAAHEEDLIHRDIKPGNIMVRRKDMKVKVTDFGIVKEEETIKSEQGVTRGIIGTLLYMAPEQITALQPLDRRVDIYALGILLYEMLACRVPFAGQSDFETMMMHLNSQVPSLSRIRNDVPRFIDAIIQKACAKDRNQRFSTTSEMSAALRAARGHAVVQPVQPVLPLPLVPPVPVVSGDSNKISIGRWALAGGLMVCVCIGVGAMWILSQLSMGASAEMPAGSTRSAGLVGSGASPPQSTVALTLPTAITSQKRPSLVPIPPPRSTPTGGAIASGSAGSASIPRRTTAVDPLRALVGWWKSASGCQYEAVMDGDVLKLYIRDGCESLKEHGYLKGDTRFVLSNKAGKIYAESHIRFSLESTSGRAYDREKDSCFTTRDSVDGTKLTAERDDDGVLVIEMAQLVGLKENVRECSGVSAVKATKAIGKLTRVANQTR